MIRGNCDYLVSKEKTKAVTLTSKQFLQPIYNATQRQVRCVSLCAVSNFATDSLGSRGELTQFYTSRFVLAHVHRV